MPATDSSVALVILNIVREQNLSIPQDISVISFDDADWAAVTPPLTVISQPIKELSTAATENLMARLLGETTSAALKVLLPTTVIERDSVRTV